jgi:acyl-[acyl-carrier-protein]-phospholipid O-acyltransferase/long-chain-fatty-acid--[acyl-carrier-protein] ligase
MQFEFARFGGKTLFQAFVMALKDFGDNSPAVEDALGNSWTWRRLMIGARVLGAKIARRTRRGEIVPLLLPNANAVAATFIGLQSAARVPAMLNYTAGPAIVVSACRTVQARIAVASRAFVEKAELQVTVDAMEAAGIEILWLEDVAKTVGPGDKALALLLHRLPIEKSKPDDPALVLFTSGSEGQPKGVVLSHANLLANCAQARARIEFSKEDRVFNVLPVFHSFGMLGGMILPLVYGPRLYLYPSPLHYKMIPQAVKRWKPTIMFGTDTFLTGYARTAKDADFSSLRLVVAGAEAVREETRRVWKERFGATVLEGFGMTEAAPVVAVNTPDENRPGTVGKLLPGIETRLEPVEGIASGGRLMVRGPNVMLGYMRAEQPGVIEPPADGWHDSGDVVEIDAEGYVAVKGRVKRFAKIAGEMVSLGAVELLVQGLWPEESHAVVSVPDKRKGERVVLVTTAGNANRDLLASETRAKGYTELMVPAGIVKVPQIPLLGTGKTDYPGARKLAIEQLGIDEAA